MNLLHGTGVALITPFNKNLQVDFEALEKLLLYTTQAKVDYWVVHGTTGEAATTTAAEKKEILTFIKAHNPANLPIVYGLGGPNTNELCGQLEGEEWGGVTAILSISPYYNRPSQEGIYAHYCKLAAASPLPILLYNVPVRTGSNIAPETVLRLGRIPNIIGIKEASGNLLTALEILQHKPDNFLVIAGEDALALSMIAMGGAGVIATLANVIPKEFVNMIRAALSNRYEEARRILYHIYPICQFIAQYGNPVATKQLLAARKICHPYVRGSLTTLELAMIEQAERLLKDFHTC